MDVTRTGWEGVTSDITRGHCTGLKLIHVHDAGTSIESANYCELFFSCFLFAIKTFMQRALDHLFFTSMCGGVRQQHRSLLCMWIHHCCDWSFGLFQLEQDIYSHVCEFTALWPIVGQVDEVLLHRCSVLYTCTDGLLFYDLHMNIYVMMQCFILWFFLMRFTNL